MEHFSRRLELMAEVVAAAGFGCRLVLAQALIDHLAQKVVVGPGEIFDFGDELGPHPMHAAQDQRRFEAAGARRGTSYGGGRQ